MRITDLSIIVHRWDVPRTTYRETFGGGHTDVGVVTIQTDEGVVGHSFLGSASAGAGRLHGVDPSAGHAPTAPGLGYEIDWDLVKRKQVAELR